MPTRAQRSIAFCLALTLSSAGCAHNAGARAVGTIGLLAIGVGLLIAGACGHDESQSGSGALCSGEPSAENVGEGAAVIAVGSALMLASQAMDERERVQRKRKPVVTTTVGPRVMEVEPEAKMEPQVNESRSRPP